MNKVVLVGRLTRDPETRQAGETTVTRFSIAVDRRYKHEGGQSADFPSVVAFGKTAEFIEKYFHKGMKIALEGRLQTGSYEKDGKRIYTTDVIAEAVEFAESKSADAGTTTNNAWVEIPEGVEEELPF
jgi:single-strand DNA-binding protein